MFDRQMARALGWISIGLGVAEIVAPKKMEQFMGIADGKNTTILRIMGIREVLQGVDILSHRDPAPGVWARVAGDAVDAVLLSAAARKTRRPRGMAAAFALAFGITALDVLTAKSLSERR
ncbi:MAG TPA: hypothetical protein VEK08_01440 [Planctomycetota bacterium]|nr:hypothetical protein [Planctomycetota bacterium]